MNDDPHYLPSDIQGIRMVVKYGAFGNPDAVGVWYYGRRRDGKTVPCKNKMLDNGRMRIWSEYWKDDEYREDATEFTADEWSHIMDQPDAERRWAATTILNARSK